MNDDREYIFPIWSAWLPFIGIFFGLIGTIDRQNGFMLYSSCVTTFLWCLFLEWLLY